MTVENGPPTPLFGGVQYPGTIVWLPDGRTLIFSGVIGGRTGIWSLKRDGSSLTLLAEIAGALSLSPDGKQLVALRGLKGDADTSEVVMVDLP
jgi:Tol biopolymer transport system component